MTFSIRIRLLEGQRTSLVIPRSRIAPAVACALLAGTALMALSSGIAHAQQGLLYYVPNGVSDSVSVFSTNANGSLTPVTTISGIGNNPEQIAVRGDQAFAYVSLNLDNQLKVIDTRTNTVVQTLSTVTGPRGVAVSLNAMRVAVANNTGGVNTVSVFTADPLTGQLSPLATIPTGSNTQPRRVVFSPDSSRLFIANQGNLGANGSVSVVDTATNTVVATVATGGQLTDIAVNPAGTRVYVTSTTNQVFVIDTATNSVVASLATGGDSRGVVVSLDGTRFYVTNQNTNSINQFDAATNISLGTVAAGGTPFGIVRTPNGAFAYTVNNTSGNVSIYSITSGTGLLVAAGTVATGVAPTYAGLCGSGNVMLAAGNVFVANTAGAFGCVGANPTVAGTLVVSPGVIGNMAVTGNMSLAAGSRLRVETDSAGNSDRIALSGRATLGGGTVDVQAAAGDYRKNTTYTILTASGGVTGTFAGATSNLAFLTPSLFYDPSNVFLALTRNDMLFSALAQTPNQRAVANYLDQTAANPALANLVASIEGLSAEQARTAFASIGGDSLSAFGTVAITESARFMTLLSGRLGAAGAGAGLADSGIRLAAAGAATGDAPPLYAQAGGAVYAPRLGSGRGFWLQAGGSQGNMDGDGNAAGFDWFGGGLAAGVDAEVADSTVLGAAVAYGRSDVDLDAGGSGEVNSPRLALYGSHAAGAWVFRAAAGYANQDFESRRLVTIGANAGVAASSHAGDEWSAYGEAEYTVPMGRYQLKPLLGLRYINLKEDGYTETGSAAPLTVAERTTESIVSLLGARYVRPINAGAGAFEFRAIWSHEFGDANPAVTGRVAGTAPGASFTVAGVPIERDAAILGAGFSNQVGKNLLLYADFNAELRGSGQNQYALVGGLRYAW